MTTTETTWTHAMPGAARATRGAALARRWRDHVLAPLDRALDAALRLDDVRALNGATLADIGLRRD